jgi:hypothetical protein
MHILCSRRGCHLQHQNYGPSTPYNLKIASLKAVTGRRAASKATFAEKQRIALPTETTGGSNLTFDSDQGFRPDAAVGMRADVALSVFSADLDTAVCAGQQPERPVWRAQMFLLAAKGVGTSDHAPDSKSKNCVRAGRDAVPTRALKCCCATRRGLRIPKLDPAVVEARSADDGGAVAEATHWTGKRWLREPASASLTCSASGAPTA